MNKRCLLITSILLAAVATGLFFAALTIFFIPASHSAKGDAASMEPIVYEGIASRFHPVTRSGREVSPSSRTEKQIQADDSGITEIGMERTPCYGSCPVYTVIIKKDGSFQYKGERHVERLGFRTGKVSQYGLRNLLQFLKETDYFSLEDRCGDKAIDAATVYTYVAMGEKMKIIQNEGNGGPIKLWVLEELIDKLLLDAEWDEKNKEK